MACTVCEIVIIIINMENNDARKRVSCNKNVYGESEPSIVTEVIYITQVGSVVQLCLSSAHSESSSQLNGDLREYSRARGVPTKREIFIALVRSVCVLMDLCSSQEAFTGCMRIKWSYVPAVSWSFRILDICTAVQVKDKIVDILCNL